MNDGQLPTRDGAEIATWLEQGLAHYTRGEVQHAVEQWLKILRVEPAHRVALEYIGYARDAFALDDDGLPKQRDGAPSARAEGARPPGAGHGEAGSIPAPVMLVASAVAPALPMEVTSSPSPSSLSSPSPSVMQAAAPSSVQPSPPKDAGAPAAMTVVSSWSELADGASDVTPDGPARVAPPVSVGDADGAGAALEPSWKRNAIIELGAPAGADDALPPAGAASDPWDDVAGGTALSLDSVRVVSAVEFVRAPAREAPGDARPEDLDALDSTGPAGDAPWLEASASAAAPEDEIEGWMAAAREAHALGDFSGSLALVERVLARAPAHEGALAYVRNNEETLQRMFEARIGDLRRKPVVAMSSEEVVWLNLDHTAGFLLAQVDGQVSFLEIILVSGLRRFDALRILADLVRQGAIR